MATNKVGGSPVRVISDKSAKNPVSGHPVMGVILPPSKGKTHGGKPVLGVIMNPGTGGTGHIMGRLVQSDGKPAPAGSAIEGKAQGSSTSTHPLFGVMVDPKKRHKPVHVFGLIVKPDGTKTPGTVLGRVVDPGSGKPLFGMFLPPKPKPTSK
jgi:hypothetical protein